MLKANLEKKILKKQNLNILSINQKYKKYSVKIIKNKKHFQIH